MPDRAVAREGQSDRMSPTKSASTLGNHRVADGSTLRNRTLVFLFFGLVMFLVACTPPKPPVQPPLEKEPTPGAECATNADCIPAQCCHATGCVPKTQAPDCAGMFCTQDCQPGTIDCGGGCVCMKQKCEARLVYEPGEPVMPGEKDTPESCAAKGGDWQTRMAGQFCNERASDGGKPCMDSDECEGACLESEPGKGACSEYQTVFSCVTLIEDGKPFGSLCID